MAPKIKKYLSLIGSLILVMGVFTECQAQDKDNVSIIEYGTYGKELKIGTQQSPNSTSGIVTHVEGPVLLKQTNNIKVAYGTRFGVRILAKGKGAFGKLVPVEIHVIHPPMTNPSNNQTTTIDKWNMQAQLGIPLYTGWEFTDKYELVAGTWVFKVVKDEQVLSQQSFHITTGK